MPVLRPGKPDESLFVTLLTEKDVKRRMPLDADPLPAEEIALIRKWVDGRGGRRVTKPAEVHENGASTSAARAGNRRKLDCHVPDQSRVAEGAAAGVDAAGRPAAAGRGGGVQPRLARCSPSGRTAASRSGTWRPRSRRRC